MICRKNHASLKPIKLFSSLLPVLLLMAAGCAGSATATGARGGRGAADEATVFIGTWEGTFSATDFDGGMRLVLLREGEEWSGTLDVSVMDESASGEILTFEQEGITCTFHSFIEGGDVFFRGSVEEGTMSGTFEVYVEGELADEGLFKFTKK